MPCVVNPDLPGFQNLAGLLISRDFVVFVIQILLTNSLFQYPAGR